MLSSFPEVQLPLLSMSICYSPHRGKGQLFRPHRFLSSIRVLSKIASAIAWSVKLLFDLMVVLLTIYKSTKYKQAPRPVLIDMLIADGMNPSTT